MDRILRGYLRPGFVGVTGIDCPDKARGFGAGEGVFEEAGRSCGGEIASRSTI